MNPRQIRNWLVSGLLALLAACGGGGNGGSGTSTSADVFQLRTAFINYILDNSSQPFSLSGYDNGVSYSGSGTATQGSLYSVTFEGHPALQKTSTATGTLTANGQSRPLAVSATAYVDGNYNVLGFYGNEYEVVSTSNPIPATAKVNDTGVWYTTTRYTSPGKTTRNGTATATFVLEPDTANTALLKIITVERDNSNVPTSTNTNTFRITPAGGLTRISETLVEGTSSLTINY